LSTYRIVIECCVAANQSEQALQVLQSCIAATAASNQQPPTTYAFELVVLSLCRNRQWRRARTLLDDMERLDVPRNLAIYNALLQACQRAQEKAAAQQLLTRLERREPHSLQPNVRSYNAVMAVCATTLHWTEAINILDRIHRAPGVEPDLYSYTK
jgi:pentatricopeptide repeat protein